MKKEEVKNILWIILICQLAIYLIYSLLIFSGAILKINSLVWGNFIISVVSFGALISFYLFSKSLEKNFTLNSWSSIFLIGLLLFLLGDLSWFGNEAFIAKASPIGGNPDLFWNIGEIFLIASLANLALSLKYRSKIIPIFIVFIFTIIGLISFNQSLQNFDILFFSMFIQFIYPVYDFVMIGILFAILLSSKNSKLPFKFIYFLIFGVITKIVYDNLFARMIVADTYYTGHWADLIYLLFYLFISLGVMFYSSESK